MNLQEISTYTMEPLGRIKQEAYQEVLEHRALPIQPIQMQEMCMWIKVQGICIPTMDQHG